MISNLLPAAAGACLLTVCGLVHAQEGNSTNEVEPAPLTLEPVIVIGTRFEEAVANVPYAASLLPDRKIIERASRTLPEALKEMPGVLVQKTAHGHGSPFIRGLTSFRNVALIDGIRFNHSAFRDGPNQYWNTIDSYSAGGIELVRGQGSVLYGSDAMGGVLNVRTKRPAYAESGFLSAGRMIGRYSTAEDSYIGRVEGSLSEADRYGLFLGFSGKQFGDLRAADLGWLPNTGYDEWDIDGKLEWFLDPDTRLTVYHQQVHQDDVWRTHRTVFSKSWNGTAVGSDRARIFDQDRWLTYIQMEGVAEGALADRYQASFSHQRHSEERYRERGNRRFEIQGFDIDTYGAWLQLEKETSIGTLVYGASYYQDRGDTFRSDFNADGSLRARRIQGPVGDEATYHLAGAFVQDKIELTERVDAYVGGRYTFAEADIGRVEDPETRLETSIRDSWNSVVGNGRVMVGLDDERRYQLFAGVSQGFRSPNFSDLSRLDSNRSSEIETPSAGLDPEKSVSYEFGLTAGADRMRGGLSYYYNDLSDLIVRTPTGRFIEGEAEVTKQNAGDGFVHGVELWWDWEVLPRVSLFGNFAWQDGELDTFPTSDPVKVREPVSKLLPMTAQAGVRWENGAGNLWIEGLVRIADRQDRLNTRDKSDTQRIPPGGTPGYTTATIRGGWQAYEGLLITAAVENVFDEDYRIHGSGQNEPGVNFVIGAEVSF